MSAPMTLEQVRDWHKQIQGDLAGPLASEFHKDCVAAIDAHIAQPAQAVNVVRLRGLIDEFWNLAYAEGKEGRTTDTPAGDAQRVSSEIESIISAIASPTPDKEG